MKFAIFYSRKGIVEIEAENEDEAEEKFWDLGELDLDENENLEIDDVEEVKEAGKP